MRCIVRTVLLAFVLLAALCASAAARQHRPVALHLRWRLVTTEPGYVAASDRYVAIIRDRGPDAVSPITLIDEQKRAQQTLTPAGCARPTSPMFGGSYLLVVCAYGSYGLFDIASGQWVTVKASCPSDWNCGPAGIGRYWLKLAGGPVCSEHCTTSYLLQDLRTGAVKHDSATPGGRIYDDLSVPSGSRLLCSPLRYPRVLDDAGHWELGQVTFEGPFAFTTGNQYTSRQGLTPVYRLRRCGSRLDLQMPPSNPPTPLVSSRAVIWQDGATGLGDRPARLAGRFLPSLEPFTAVGSPLPKNPYSRVLLAALSRRTIYMRADTGEMWEASVPR
jgi:hypothetical protein